MTSDNGANVLRTRVYVWSNSDSSSNLVSTAETSTDGLQTWNNVWNGGVAATTHSVTAYGAGGARTVTVTAPDQTYTVSQYSYGRLTSVTHYPASGSFLTQATYGYDEQGRQNTVTDARTGTTTYYFNNADQVSGLLTPAVGSPSAPEFTTNYFDKLGRLVATQLPDQTWVTNVYCPNGLLQLTYGSRVYPVSYSYDGQGRLLTNTTWSSYNTQAGARMTSWSYAPYRGWLSSKTYPGNTPGPSYLYTAAGRLYQRTWARGITTTYTTNSAGDVATVTYSDGTPSLSHNCDRRGRLKTVTQNGMTTALTYNDANQLLSEANTGGNLAGLAVTSGFDSCLRRRTLSLNTVPALAYAYNYSANTGWLQNVTDGAGNAVAYSYLANSPLVQQITYATNGTTQMATTRQYDNLNRLTQVASAPSSVPSLSAAYAYNPANQRTALTNGDNSYWAYQYNSLGQVTNAVKRWSDGTVVAGQQFAYQFDTIGNRTGTDAGGDALGANLRHAAYTPDGSGLNQYTNRTVPGYVQNLGAASASANVALWTTNHGYALAVRKGSYFRAELPLNNRSAAVWLPLTNVALLPGGSSADTVTFSTGNVFVAQSPETFGYDGDGNLTNDGHWALSWDAENRLVGVRTLSSNLGIGPQTSLLFEYDWKGRRTHKEVWPNATQSGSPTSNEVLVYDGWNLLARLNATNQNVIQSYVWGLDLSGSEQGAGGVGGLLEVRDGANGATYYVAYDGNGNVSGLVNAGGGTSAATYEYGPFGEVIRITGQMAKANPFRFSTKYQDDETDLLYFGGRYYSLSQGRWLSRDPGGEPGGLNVYGYTYNSPPNFIDPDGVAPQMTGFTYNPCTGAVSPQYMDQQSGQGYDIGLHSPWNTPSQMILNQRAIWEQTTCCQSATWYFAVYMLTDVSAGLAATAENPVQAVAMQAQDLGQLGSGIGQGTASGVLADVGRVSGLILAAVPIKGACCSKAGATVDQTALAQAKAAAQATAQRVAQIRLTTPAGDLRAAGIRDAHHVVQDAAVRDLPGYDSQQAPAVQLPGPSTDCGSLHYAATQVQRQAGGGTVAAEMRIGYKALRRAGFSEAEARRIMVEVDAYFRSIGVSPETPTRIPGNRN